MEDPQGKWQHFDGLPWFLSDMRPQGFLGRAWGRECALQLGLPEDIRLWNEGHTLIALSARGYDVAGGWLIGQQSYQTWLLQPAPCPIPLEEKVSLYPTLAEKVLAGEEVGSSAGGEQPKFACYAERQDRSYAHLLVKFTPARQNENSQRWCDLLRAEALALQLMNEEGISAAGATIFAGPHGQLFLEVVRFDRLG